MNYESTQNILCSSKQTIEVQIKSPLQLCIKVLMVQRENSMQQFSKFGAHPCAQDTLHYGASNEIKEIEVCKKCPKVEPYFVPIFDPIVVKPCLDDAK